MTSQDRIKAVLGQYKIEEKGNQVLVEGILTIFPEKMQVPSVTGTREVQGWTLWLDDGEDASVLLTDRRIDPVLVKAAAVLAEWKAKDMLRLIQEQEWVDEFLADQRAEYYA